MPVNVEIWIQQLVNALTIGGMYTLVAVGFTLFFGVLRLINFAHGEVFMFGAFTGLVIAWGFEASGVEPGLGVILAMFAGAMSVCAVLGAVMERFAYRPVRGMPPLIMLVTSLAVGIALREAVKEFFPEGANPHPYVSPYSFENITVGGVILDYTQIGLIVSSLAMVYAIYLVVDEDLDRPRHAGHLRRSGRRPHDGHRGRHGHPKHLPAGVGARRRGRGHERTLLPVDPLRHGLGNGDQGIHRRGHRRSRERLRCDVRGAMWLAIVEVLIVALVPEGSRYKDVGVFLLLILVLVFRPSGLIGAAPQKMG